MVWNDAIMDVNFAVPPRADDQFRALVRDFHLVPVDTLDGTLELAGVSASPPENAEKPKRKVIPLKAADLRPNWKLFTTAEWDW